MSHYKQPIQKKKTDKNKRIIAYVLLCFFAFWTIASCLTIFLSLKDCKTAKADSVDVGYHFIGSNVILNTLVFPNNNYADNQTYGTITNSFVNFRVEFMTGQFSAYNTYGGFNFAYNLISATSSSFNSYFYSATSTTLDSIRFVVAKNYVNIDGLYYRGWYYQYPASTLTWTTFSSSVPTFVNNGWYLFKSGSNTYMWIYFNMENDFTGNIYKVEEGNEPVHISQTGDQATELTGFINYVKYYDINNKVATFGFYTYLLQGSNQYEISIFKNNTAGKFFTLQDRTYYLDFSVSDSESYQLGYTQGLNDNQPTIYDNGYSSGYLVGRSAGYNVGYQEGVNNASNYTFLSLIGSVVDAPITAIAGHWDSTTQTRVGGLLNFDILGFNLSNLFFALLTLALIIFVVRLFIGGK